MNCRSALLILIPLLLTSGPASAVEPTRTEQKRMESAARALVMDRLARYGWDDAAEYRFSRDRVLEELEPVVHVLPTTRRTHRFAHNQGFVSADELLRDLELVQAADRELERRVARFRREGGRVPIQEAADDLFQTLYWVALDLHGIALPTFAWHQKVPSLPRQALAAVAAFLGLGGALGYNFYVSGSVYAGTTPGTTALIAASAVVALVVQMIHEAHAENERQRAGDPIIAQEAYSRFVARGLSPEVARRLSLEIDAKRIELDTAFGALGCATDLAGDAI